MYPRARARADANTAAGHSILLWVDIFRISMRRRWWRHTLRTRPPSRGRERPAMAVSVRCVRRPSPIRSRRGRRVRRFASGERRSLARCWWWWFALPRDSSPTPTRTSQVRRPPVHKGQGAHWFKRSQEPSEKVQASNPLLEVGIKNPTNYILLGEFQHTPTHAARRITSEKPFYDRIDIIKYVAPLVSHR
ncbi:hypothetical protein GQ55_3G205400 [Panicum hallii var. hallii]|uniref:Uncharacterized protein n=1 Tax=Panicum hallii var. hallii TaxID=1504633 RepID=A0A2T7EBJ3_9POAL|nr:hypothetical protein GQ55_3G205400 [Panicum hallii var. hallii]